MEPGTKAKLVLALVILLAIVLAVWWTAEKKKPQRAALVGIDYNPNPSPGSSHLVYTLATPPPEGNHQVTVTSFAAEGANQAVVAALTTGSAAGGVPFVPTVSGVTLSTNTVPAALVAATSVAASLRGVGTVEFTPAP